MDIAIPYNGSSVTVSVDDGRVAGVLRPNSTPVRDEREVLAGVLAGPLGSEPFQSFLSGRQHPLFIVNDADRNTPTPKVLDAVRTFIPLDQCRFLVATGSHPRPTDAELDVLFGGHIGSVRPRLFVHDARDDARLVSYGTTRRGTEVRLNRLFSEADCVVTVGSVEPHYFAGWTGGRKFLLPGIAGFRSIEQNHRLALEDGSAVTALQGNPVHEDMDEALDLAGSKPVFSIQLVLDAEGRICFAAAGNMRDAFAAAVEQAKKVYCVPVREKADKVVAVAAPPLDASLYQAHKAVENVRSILKEGGILILVSACPKGIGNDSFVRLFQKAGSPKGVFQRLQDGYVLGYHKAAKLADLMNRARIWAVTGLQPDILTSMFIRPFHSVQKALDCAAEEKKDGQVLFVLSATTVVPTIKSSEFQVRNFESQIRES